MFFQAKVNPLKHVQKRMIADNNLSCSETTQLTKSCVNVVKKFFVEFAPGLVFTKPLTTFLF
jgi:hypothetical protein